MAELIPPMLIKLQADVNDLKVGLSQAQKDFSNFGDTVTKQTGFLAKFKAAATGVFAGNLMTQGLMAVKTAFSDAIQDAQIYEQTLAKTNAVIQSTGGIAGVSAKHLQEQASALESIAAVDENVILNGENVIATFTNIRNVAGQGNDIFDQTTKAALDLSAALGQDMQSSAIQLGKALNDPIQGMVALRRVGVSFDAQQQQTIKGLVESGKTLEAQKLILAEVNREFGGAAKAAGDTFAGAVFRAKDKAQDFARDLILNLQPILLNIGKTIGNLYDTFLKPLLHWFMAGKEAIVAFVVVLGTAFVAMKAWGVILTVNKVIQEAWAVATTLMKGAELASIASTNGLAASMLALNAIMEANPIAVVVTAVAILAAGFVLLWNKVKPFREGVVEVMKVVVHAIGWVIGAVGEMITAWLKFSSGPLRLVLGALSHLPGVGSAAKKALDFINEGTKDVGGFFDAAKKKVDGFADGLDKLKNKKIGIPGFGAGKETTDAAAKAASAADVVTKDQLKNQQKNLAQLQKYQKQVQGIYDDMNKAIADGEKKKNDELDKYNQQKLDLQKKYDEEAAKLQKRYDDVVATATKKREEQDAKTLDEYNKKKLDLETSYQEKVASIRTSAAQKTADLTAQAAQKQLDIIQQSMDRLRSAFASKTAFSLTDAFGGGASGEDLVAKLKDSLAGAKKLQENAASLAGLGYSQTFIEEVVKNGPEIGNKMAEALKDASPETTKQMQDLYKQVQNVSEHGLDTLAATMNAGGNLATDELMKAFNQVQVDLKQSLSVVNTEMDASLNEATKNFNTAMSEAQATRDAALADSLKTFNEAKAAAQADLDAGLADAQKTLQEALIQAQKDYQKAIDDINAATQAKLDDLKKKIADVAAQMAALGAAQAAAAAMANAPVATFTPISSTATSFQAATGGNFIGPIPAGATRTNTGYVTNNNTTVSVTGYNLTDPTATASKVISDIKYGQTVVATSTVTTSAPKTTVSAAKLRQLENLL